MRRHIAPPLRDHTHAGQPLLLKVKPPRWVILFPGASFYITHRMLRSRAAALAQMNDRELRAILAHELAHDQHEHTFSARFFGGAESAPHNIIDGMHAGISHHARASLCAARAARLRHHHASGSARSLRSRAPTRRHAVRRPALPRS
jgi:hypothetical protein